MSMIIKGYLEDVLLPGGFHTTVNKGIANLTLKETGIVIAALKAGTMSIKKIAEAKRGMFLFNFSLRLLTNDLFIQLKSSLLSAQ